MLYTLTFFNCDTKKLETTELYSDTVAEARDYGIKYAKALTENKVAQMEFQSVSPLEDSPKITPRFIYDLPGEAISDGYWLVATAIRFVNNSALGEHLTLPDYGYNEGAILSEGRLHVERKVHKYIDYERSDSLYVISFDCVRLGYYIGEGRSEDDCRESLVTNLTRTKELIAYLQSHFKDPYGMPEPKEHGLDEPIPNAYDWLTSRNVFVPPF